MYVIEWIYSIFEYSRKPTEQALLYFQTRLYLEHATLNARKRIENLNALPKSQDYVLENSNIKNFFNSARLKDISTEDVYIFTLDYAYNDLSDSASRAQDRYFSLPAQKRFCPPMSGHSGLFLIRAFKNKLMLETIYKGRELNGKVKLNDDPLVRHEVHLTE